MFEAMPGIPSRIRNAADAARSEVQPVWQRLDAIALANQIRVLGAFQDAGVNDSHFAGSTGYGYSDAGRDKLEQVFAAAFGAEAALVRLQIASGTHAVALGLFGCLRPGDEMIAATGTPYDTLQEVINGGEGSLAEWGVTYREVPLNGDGTPDVAGVVDALGPGTRLVLVQRSRGYALRPALSVARVGELVRAVKARRPAAIVFVDNCYGEFVEVKEPTHVGADLVAGSLIKNPGGGLAPAGGYVCGRRDLVERAATRLTAPGIGSHVGANFGQLRLLFQGLFMAPHVVAEALRGAVFAAALFSRLGLRVSPAAGAERGDLIQAVELGSPAAVLAFCQAVQRCSPIDSGARPEPEVMAGYRDAVVMAAGTFIQGATLEFSADGPLRPPYAVFMQGGLTREHVMAAVLAVAADLEAAGLLPVGTGGA